MEPQLVSIQVGLPRQFENTDAPPPMDQPWFTGFYKLPISGPVRVGVTQIEGDGQADLENHGGPDKAVLAYSADHYPIWRAEIETANPPFGAFGENLTIANLDESTVCIGDIWKVQNVRFEVSQPRQPCWKLAWRWQRNDLPRRVIETGRSGWYLRVKQGGYIKAGDPFILEARPNPKWSIREANELMFHRTDDRAAMIELAAVRQLSASWQGAFQRRADALA